MGNGLGYGLNCAVINCFSAVMAAKHPINRPGSKMSSEYQAMIQYSEVSYPRDLSLIFISVQSLKSGLVWISKGQKEVGL